MSWCTVCGWSSAAGPDKDPTPTNPARWSHGVRIYEDGLELVLSLEEHLVPAWVSGGTAVVIATPEHRSALLGRLAARGHLRWLDEGRLVELDAAQTLDLFMRDGTPDAELFEETVGALVRKLAQRGPLHAFGEMVDLLWADGNVVGALELERIWGALQNDASFSLLCAYADGNVDYGGRVAIAGVHDHIFP